MGQSSSVTLSHTTFAIIKTPEPINPHQCKSTSCLSLWWKLQGGGGQDSTHGTEPTALSTISAPGICYVKSGHIPEILPSNNLCLLSHLYSFWSAAGSPLKHNRPLSVLLVFKVEWAVCYLLLSLLNLSRLSSLKFCKWRDTQQLIVKDNNWQQHCILTRSYPSFTFRSLVWNF